MCSVICMCEYFSKGKNKPKLNKSGVLGTPKKPVWEGEGETRLDGKGSQISLNVLFYSLPVKSCKNSLNNYKSK